jgi:AraC-like DNA-binding protein
MKRKRPAGVRFPKSDIYVIESQHSDDFRMDWTRHAFPKILYAWKGAGCLWTEKAKYPLSSGRILLVPDDVRHRIVDVERKPLSLYVLFLRNPSVTNLFRENGLTACRMIGNEALGAIAKRLFRDILYEQTLQHPGADAIILGLVFELAGHLIRWREGRLERTQEATSGRSISRARVAALIRDLDNNFYRHQSLETASSQVGLRPRRFSQLFHTVTGKSWPAYLREKRIEHARHLLAETDRSLVGVCFECGFGDLSSFYRAFARMEGTSPKVWRERKLAGAGRGRR